MNAKQQTEQSINANMNGIQDSVRTVVQEKYNISLDVSDDSSVTYQPTLNNIDTNNQSTLPHAVYSFSDLDDSYAGIDALEQRRNTSGILTMARVKSCVSDEIIVDDTRNRLRVPAWLQAESRAERNGSLASPRPRCATSNGVPACKKIEFGN